MNIRSIELPACVRAVVTKLIATIAIAESIQALNIAGQHAEGFVLGLETASALKPNDIETLYVGFAGHVEVRLGELRQLFES